MHSDLSTLYIFLLWSLLVSALMTFWEAKARAHRAPQLRIMAAGYVVLMIGCAIASVRGEFAGMFVSAAANLVLTAGYLLLLHGLAAINERSYRRASLVLIGVLIAGWTMAAGWQDMMWRYVSAWPIAAMSAAMAYEALAGGSTRGWSGRRVVAAIAAGHALFYAVRGLVPLFDALQGEAFAAAFARMTMYEGILFAVGLPMAVLAMIREEGQDALLEALRTDYLTGLGNRMWFFEEGAATLRRQAMTVPSSVLAIDLDRFKAINDRHGHAAGDDVMRSFARIARVTFGEKALLARIGGEEFAALLVGVDETEARALADLTARRFAATTVHGDQAICVHATVSIGIAGHRIDGSDLAQLLGAADRALYLAKARGRNRVERAEPATYASAA